jgi:hypothetical protein
MHKVFWLENLNGTDHLEDLGIDGTIILERIESSGSINGGEFD